MDTRVGARMEVVSPPRLLAASDAWYLLALVAAAAALHAWLVSTTFVTARDSLGFARLALSFESPAAAGANPDGSRRTVIDVLKAAEHPPGYPLTVVAVARAVRPFYAAPPPEQMLLSCQLASAAAGVVLVLPSFLLGRALFGRFPGFAAALLFQALPVVAHVTSDGLSEALYLVFMAAAAGFGVLGVRHRSTKHFLLCGAATGAAYLVRPEGLMAAVAVGGVVAVLGLAGRWPRAAAAGRLVALGVGALAVATPYMLLIEGVSRKTTTNEILNRIQGHPRSKLGAWESGEGRAAPTTALFAAWYDPTRREDKTLWAAKATASEVWKAAHYAPCALAVLGLWGVRRRMFAEPEQAVLPVLAGINLAVLFVLGLLIGYVSERHTLLLVLLVCYYAAAALEPAAGLILSATKSGAIALLAVLILTSLPGTLKPLHENRLGHYHAGKFLATAATPADTIVDPFSWALFFSGRTLYSVPDDPPNARVVYSVVEVTKDSPHSRLPRREDALNVARDGWSEVVFQWPADKPKVVVYKLDGGSKDAVAAAGGGSVVPFLVRPGPRPLP